MAEKIVSPGVFTRERDLSFLPAGISQIGAAIIGPTVKGPAFEPVIIESFKEFEQVFGPKTEDSYVPYTVEGYLKSAGRVTIVRVLGLTGYTPKLIGIKVSGGSGVFATATLTFTGVPAVDETITIIDAAGLSKTYTAKGADNIASLQFQQSSGAATVVDTLQQCIEHANGHNGSITVSQPTSTSLLLTMTEDGVAGNTTITSGLANATIPAAFTGGQDIDGSVADEVFAVLHPTQVDSDATFTPSLITATSQIDLKLTADSYTSTTNFTTGQTLPFTYSGSIDTTAENYLGKIFGFTPKHRTQPVYNYMLFNNYASRSLSQDSTLTTAVTNANNDLTIAYGANNAYEARTPFIVSQNLGSYESPKTTRLFKIHTRSHGACENYAYKIAISNIKDGSAVAGSDYGTFSLALRRVDLDGTIHSANTPYAKSTDKDLRPHIVEQFNNVTLDPNSPNFIARVIGDRYQSVDANGKITVFGDYPNLSNYIRVEVPEDVKDQAISPDLVPFGFEALSQPIVAAVGTLPTASFVGHTNTAVERLSGGTETTHKIKKTYT